MREGVEERQRRAPRSMKIDVRFTRIVDDGIVRVPFRSPISDAPIIPIFRSVLFVIVQSLFSVSIGVRFGLEQGTVFLIVLMEYDVFHCLDLFVLAHGNVFPERLYIERRVLLVSVAAFNHGVDVEFGAIARNAAAFDPQIFGHGDDFIKINVIPVFAFAVFG